MSLNLFFIFIYNKLTIQMILVICSSYINNEFHNNSINKFNNSNNESRVAIVLASHNHSVIIS